MGGDFAPHATLQGAREALEAWPGLHLLLVGNEGVIRPLLAQHGFTPELMTRTELVHAFHTVAMDDKATCILKEKKDKEQETKLFRALICNTGKSGNVMHTPISLCSKACTVKTIKKLMG